MIRPLHDAADRARRLRSMTAEMLRTMSPQHRDRMLQQHLSLARGRKRNALLCRQLTATLLRARRCRLGEDPIMLDDPLVDALQVVTQALDRFRVPYAITGSVASSYHGELWTSEDIDLMVRMSAEQAAKVAAELPPRFYVDVDTWMEEARSHGMVKLLDQATGLKIDISMLAAGGYHDRVFERRCSTDLGGAAATFQIVSPEDIILLKLDRRKDSRSHKQWENVLSVARAQGARLDWKYMFQQAADLGITRDLEQLRDEAGI